MEKIFALDKPKLSDPLYEFYSNNVRIDLLLEYLPFILLFSIFTFGVPYLIIRAFKPTTKEIASEIFLLFFLQSFSLVAVFILFFSFIAPIIFAIKDFIIKNIAPDLPSFFGLILFLPFLWTLGYLSWPFYILKAIRKQ